MSDLSWTVAAHVVMCRRRYVKAPRGRKVTVRLLRLPWFAFKRLVNMGNDELFWTQGFKSWVKGSFSEEKMGFTPSAVTFPSVPAAPSPSLPVLARTHTPSICTPPPLCVTPLPSNTLSLSPSLPPLYLFHAALSLPLFSASLSLSPFYLFHQSLSLATILTAAVLSWRDTSGSKVLH